MRFGGYWWWLLFGGVVGAVRRDGSGTTRRAPGTKDVLIQMFEWTWDSVASECTNFIGPAGYGYVQVSPPQEHVTGPQWWTDYQPVSYALTSKRGNRDQFQNMIAKCHAAGVKVIVDTIWNHMTGSDSGTGVAGSSFTHYNYPGTYQNQDFHHCGLEPNDDIANYGNRLEVQTCELVNLADLATDTEYVRARLAQYTNDLISLGVDGLRLDAAKHMAASDVANIMSRLQGSLFITQEVIWGAGEPVQPSEYVPIGHVQEFRYTTLLKNAFLGGNGIAALQNLDDQGLVPSASANAFVANHDTERNGASLNSNSPSNTYSLAHVFSLAHSYGVITVLSSYSFSDTDAGAPNSGSGTCSASGGASGWLCQHRWPAIAGMVSFRNNVGTAPIVNWASASTQQIAFGRGSAGFVVINNSDAPWAATFATSLAAGSYCDVVGGGVQSPGSCSGMSVTVSSSGTFDATIPTRSALAIHTGALGTGRSAGPGGGQSTTVRVTFREVANTNFGENIFVVGSIPDLRSWNTDNAIALSAANYPTWEATLSLPAGTAFEYKFFRRDGDDIIWESDPNRSASTQASGDETIDSTWR